MIHRRLLAAAILCLLAPLRAESAALDLSAAMERAREQAREVTAARARARAGDERAREARGFRLPKVSVQEIWLRTDSPADAFGLLLNQERFSLPDFAAGNPNDPDATENALTRLELALPLYTGGELSGRIRQARLAAEATHATAAWIEKSAALAGAEAYIRLAQIREQAGVLESSLETVRAHVQLAKAYVDQGMLVRSELLRAEVEQSRIEDLLSQARGQAKVAEANLSFRLAVDLSTSWQLAPLSDPAPLAEGLEAWLEGAELRPDLEAAGSMLAAGELEVGVRRSALLPKIGLVARQDWNDEDLFGSSGNSTSVMAVAGLDLFAGGRHRAAAAAARAELEAARSQVEQLRAGIQLEIRGAFELASSARERHRTALAALESAREGERITGERFKKGVVKTIDLLDSATARREAETRELMARAEALLASLDLAVKAGREPETVLPAGDAPVPAGATTRKTS
jgi:outer membrane protein TolC